MKRNAELIEKLLMYFEEKLDCEMIHGRSPPQIPDYTNLEVKYHILLMYQAGLIDGEVERSSTTPERIIIVHPFSLTWEGHEFLSILKNPEVTKKYNSIRHKFSLATVVQAVKIFAIEIAKDQLK
jgi:hypothetical protein